MPGFGYFLLISVATFWLVGHQIVKRRFADLKIKLSKAYESAIAVPPEDGETPRLIALCIDLMRKEHCTASFDTLDPHEQKMALHAYAVEELPGWMSKYATFALTPVNRTLIAQLRRVRASRPDPKPAQYYGAVQQQLRLRSTSES